MMNTSCTTVFLIFYITKKSHPNINNFQPVHLSSDYAVVTLPLKILMVSVLLPVQNFTALIVSVAMNNNIKLQLVNSEL